MRDDNNSIDQYVDTLRAMIKENSEDEKFTNDMRNLFNDVKDVKQYNPDDNNDNDDFEDNKNNSAFSISVGNGSTTLTHNNTGNWGFNSASGANMYFQFNGATTLRLTR